MQVKTIPAVPASDSADLADLVRWSLGLTELAVSAWASDMPTKKTPLTADEAISFAVQGLARLGLDTVRQMARDARALNLRYVELADRNGGKVPVGSPECKELDKAHHLIWGNFRREERANSVAHRIFWHREDAERNRQATVNAEPLSNITTVAPISVPPVLVSAPLPRCLTCGQRTATVHTACALPASTWSACGDCAGLRTDADGFECQTCSGVGFYADNATDTLAERTGDPVLY